MINACTQSLYRLAKQGCDSFWTLPGSGVPVGFAPERYRVKKLKLKQVYIVANGDLRLSANQVCWAEQSKMEATITKALKAEGW
ncbi:MAG TPA: hypothetical protein QGH16_07280, partial [Verrucomicrobiota bacterium]|nr:hypothetical protein [Verrucomicrobiota bacterium]